MTTYELEKIIQDLELNITSLDNKEIKIDFLTAVKKLINDYRNLYSRYNDLENDFQELVDRFAV